MSKRKFIKSAVAMGVSVTSLKYGTQEGLAKANDDNYVPYVRALKGEKLREGLWVARDPVYGRIHRDEWAVKWTADDAADRIQYHIRNEFPQDDKLIRAGWRAMSESPSGYGVSVYYQEIEKMGGGTLSPSADIDTVREKLPDKQRGEAAKDDYQTERTVPVVVKRCRQSEAGVLADKDWEDPLPGGTAMCADGCGTYASAYYNRDYDEQGMCASGHVCGSTGKDVYDASGERHGSAEIVDDGSNIDYAWVQMVPGGDNSEDDPDPILSDTNGGTDIEIYGMATDDELKSDTDTNTTYYNQGDANGRQSGNIQRFEDTWVEFGPNVDGGDSGGPLFKDDDGDGDALIAGVCVVDMDLGGSKFTTAETVDKQINGYWMTKNDSGI